MTIIRLKQFIVYIISNKMGAKFGALIKDINYKLSKNIVDVYKN